MRFAQIVLVALLVLSLSCGAYAKPKKCKFKRVKWVQAGHNELCTSACKRNGNLVPLKSGQSNICGESDTLDTPQPTDWVGGAFRDIAKDPFNPQKQCWIHRKFFEPGDDMNQPIAESSNFYCACWTKARACAPWRPKWVPHPPMATGTEVTCKTVCTSKGLVVVDRTPESFNYLCRISGDPSSVGWEHYETQSPPGSNMTAPFTTMCHYVKYDPVDDLDFNWIDGNYDCLCQRK